MLARPTPRDAELLSKTLGPSMPSAASHGLAGIMWWQRCDGVDGAALPTTAQCRAHPNMTRHCWFVGGGGNYESVWVGGGGGGGLISVS